MSVQEQRTEASRTLLIDAALQIVGAAGIQALTAARIEAVSGASRGLISYHFGSKQGLLEAVIRRAHDVIAAIPDLAAAESTTGADAILGIVRGYIAQLRREPQGHRAILILMTESVAAQPALRDAIRALDAVLRDRLRRQIARGLADGSIRSDLDPEAESFVIAGLLRGIALQWLLDPSTIDLDRAEESAAAAVARAYR